MVRNGTSTKDGKKTDTKSRGGMDPEVTAGLNERAAAERENAAHEIEDFDEGSRAAISRAIKQRRATRLTKVDDEKAKSLDDAVVLTKDGDVDFRIAENASKFKPDPLKTVEGGTDQRFFENRPDLQKVKAQRGGKRANRIFTPDMDPDFKGK